MNKETFMKYGLHHLALAIVMVVIVLLLNPSVYVLIAMIPSAYYTSRELTQAEYRWISKFGNKKRENLPWWGKFDYRVWDRKSLCDFLVPAGALIGIALILS